MYAKIFALTVCSTITKKIITLDACKIMDYNIDKSKYMCLDGI